MSDPSSPYQSLRRLLRYARPHRKTISQACFCSVVNKIFDLAPPILIGAAIDVVVEGEGSMLGQWGIVDRSHQLALIGLATVVVWGLESVFEYLLGVLWRNLAQALQHDLRLESYQHLQQLDAETLQGRESGELMAIINDDINQLERFLDHGANALLQVATTVLVVGGLYFWISPGIAGLSFLPVPLILWGSFAFQERIAPRYAQVRERVAELNSLLANNLGGLETIQAYAAEERERGRLHRSSAAYQEANRGAIRLSSAFSPLIRMAILVGFTAVLLVGGWEAIEGEMAVGTYSVLVYMTQRLLWPLTRLGQTFDLYQRAMASTARVLDLMDLPLPDDGTETPAPVEGVLRLDQVRFAYPGREDVLRGLSMEIRAGETVALVGPTGAGKSTVARLAMRFHDPQEGSVSLDGVDLRAWRRASLRRSIAWVSQDPFLFSGTARENVAYGRPEAAEQDLVEAASTAAAWDFLQSLPQGPDTPVGERGQQLSGGQRQRLALARAVLKDAPLLILDEATSAVDNETQAAIQRALQTVSEGRSTLIIAHRLSTIRHADRILVLDQGRVVEEGRHEALLRQDGVYARLWRVQTGEV